MNDDEVQPVAPHDMGAMAPEDIAGAMRAIKATPYEWRDPATIPPRPWVYGRWFLRGTVACVVAPGGAGKSTFIAGTALALVTGCETLGKTVWGGKQRVWVWNLEDDMDELGRSIQAAALHHGFAPDDLGGRLFVDSGMEGATLCTASEEDGGFDLHDDVYSDIAEELISRGIDVLFVDPFVSSHEVEENANSKIDKIAKAWARVAKQANCCVVLVHHTSKAGSGDVTVNSARGARALPDATRCTLVLNRMSEDDAKGRGIPDSERRSYFSVSDDKHNRAPAEAADWYRITGQDLGNAIDGEGPGDNVGVAMPCELPDPFDDVTVRHLHEVQQLVANDNNCRASSQAGDWLGKKAGPILGLDPVKDADKAKINHILKVWTKNGALVIDRRKGGKNGKDVPYYKVGSPVLTEQIAHL
jgi:hypothetical protein